MTGKEQYLGWQVGKGSISIILKSPLGLVETWNPDPLQVRPVFVPTRARRAFLRGTESLWGEQCEQYAWRAAYNGARRMDRDPDSPTYGQIVGSHFLARDQVRTGLREEARRTLADDRSSRRRVKRHARTYPNAYASPAFTGRGSVLDDVLVPDRDADRYNLEARADLWLMFHGEPNRGLDFTHKGHLTVKPDEAAFRGVERAKHQASASYVTGGTVNRKSLCDGIYVGSFAVDSQGVCMVPTITYLTRAVGRGYGWQGHVKVTSTRKVSAKRKATQVKRSGSTSTFGRSVTWWTASARSLPRMWKSATDEQRTYSDLLVTILLNSVDGVPFKIGTVDYVDHESKTQTAVHWVIFDAERKTVRRSHEPASKAMNVRQYARRAALAGLVLD